MCTPRTVNAAAQMAASFQVRGQVDKAMATLSQIDLDAEIATINREDLIQTSALASALLVSFLLTGEKARLRQAAELSVAAMHHNEEALHVVIEYLCVVYDGHDSDLVTVAQVMEAVEQLTAQSSDAQLHQRLQEVAEWLRPAA